MVYTIQLVITIFTLTASYARRNNIGAYLGDPDVDQKYPYVVTFIVDHRRACSGTLISPNWILTTGECTFYNYKHKVQYGNLTVSPSRAKTVSKVYKAVKHPLQHGDHFSNKFLINSYLQLVLVETIPMKRYANISAKDYKTFTGSVVEYASLEVTHRDFESAEETVERKPLMLGQGIVTSCGSENVHDGPLLCVARTCANRLQSTWTGDSGGPLFHEGKVIGVLQRSEKMPVVRYAAVSPFIDWINLVMRDNNPNDY